MEAIIARLPDGQLEAAAAAWLSATRKLARALLHAAGNALVQYSRAGLLLKSGSRRIPRM
jgi:ABC-type arginine/histidine transport system permease subunit